MSTNRREIALAQKIDAGSSTDKKGYAHMKRRTLLATGFGAAALTTMGRDTHAQSPLSFRLLTDRPAAAQSLAERLARVTGGAISITIETTPSTGAAGFLTRVATGDADIYLTSEEAFVEIDPAFGIFSAMPGGMSPSELESWIAVADGRYMWDIIGEAYGVKAFLAGDDGPMPIWSKTPIASATDLTTRRIGSVGLGVDLLRTMGAKDVVDLLGDGVDATSLDVIEGRNAAQMDAENLLSTFSHMTTPNAGRPSASLSVGFNLARWQELSETDQLLIEKCVTAEHGSSRALAMHQSATALKAAGSAITDHFMPRDLWDAQVGAASSVMRDIMASSDLAADVGDAYMYFLSDVARWSEIGETAFFLGRQEALVQ